MQAALTGDIASQNQVICKFLEWHSERSTHLYREGEREPGQESA